jgi:hypothetical protein
MSERVWKMTSLVLLAALIVVGMATLVLYTRLDDSEQRYQDTVKSLNGITYSINLQINYGNGTKIWENNTRIPIGFSLFNETRLITNERVEATYYPQYEAYYINSINGVGGDLTNPSWAWITWRFNEQTGKWETYNTGAEHIYPSDGDIIAWYYEDTSNYPNYTPPS